MSVPLVPVPMSIISMDDPDHARQRRLVNRGFTPKRVRALTDHIRELSNVIIDEVKDRETIDFVEDFAMHVPLIVIAEMLGLDPSTRDRLYKWSDAMMDGDGHMDPDDPVLLRAAEAFGEYTAMCQELIDAPAGSTPKTTSSRSSPRRTTPASSSTRCGPQPRATS